MVNSLNDIYKKQRRNKIIFLTFILLLSFIFFITPTNTSSETYTCPTCSSTYDLAALTSARGKTVDSTDIYHCAVCNIDHDLSLLSATQKFNFDKESSVAGGQLFKSTDDSPLLTLEDLLVFDISATGQFNQLWQYALQAYERIKFAGLVLCCVYFLMDLMEKTVDTVLTAENLARSFIKLCAMLLMIECGPQFIEWALAVASFMYEQMAALAAFTDSSGNCVYNAIKNKSTFDALGDGASFIIPDFLMFVAKVIVRIIVWSRILNIVVRVIFAPIGMADCVKGGTSSQGFRYLKKIMGAAMQGALILAIDISYDLIFDVIKNMGASFGYLATVALAAIVITLMFKTSSMADDIVGA